MVNIYLIRKARCDDVIIFTKLIFELCTVAGCGTDIDTGSSVFGFAGPEKVSNMNITENKCQENSGYVHLQSDEYVTIDYTIIRNNKQDHGAVISIPIWDNTNIFRFCNVIDNKRENDESVGIITYFRNTFICENCNFARNVGTPLFYTSNTVNKTILRHCYRDSIAIGEYVRLQLEDVINNEFYLAAKYLNTGSCKALMIINAGGIHTSFCSFHAAQSGCFKVFSYQIVNV